MTKSNLATKKDPEYLKVDLKKKELKLIALETEVKVLGELKDMREEFDTHRFKTLEIVNI